MAYKTNYILQYQYVLFFYFISKYKINPNISVNFTGSFETLITKIYEVNDANSP